jgi:hypothetical protein
MIAGDVNIGIGMFFLDGPADGMVAISDTKARWLEHHVTVRCSHVGLLFSKEVAALCLDFLTNQPGGIPKGMTTTPLISSQDV